MPTESATRNNRAAEPATHRAYQDHARYDSYGNRTQTTDPNGNVSKITYDGNSLYPVTRYEAFGSTVQRQFNLTHHFATGLPTQSVDANNSITTNLGYDYLGRPTLVQEAAGAPEQRNTETDYQDDLRRVITRQGPLPGTSAKLVTVKHYDPLGRIRLTQRLENNLSESETSDTTGSKVQARYRFVSGGSVELVSNPYRASSSGGTGGEETMGWTLTERDRGGRVVSVKTYPGTNPPAPWGSNSSHTGDSTFSYSAKATTISDQAGKARTNTVDGLGRLISVAEPGPNTTSYTYDVMDNLLSVSQAGQSRTFVYSSLSRLASAANPESGTISYFYDNNGNLARKVDARNITTCFGVWNGSTCNSAVDTGYDSLNRVLRKQYSATTPETPGVTYTYDCATNGKGLPCGIANSESASNIGAYDKLARVTASNQVTSGYTYPMSYTWDIAGNLRSMTLPSSRTLAWSYDNAGRASGVTGAKSGEANKTYASAIGYAPHGALASLTMGNSMVETWNYNSRLQPRQVSAARSGTTHLSLGFFYCGSQVHSCGDNNGNLRIQTLGIPGQSWTQNYGYDGVNRLASVSETGGAGWSQSFGYDATGNRWVSAYTNLAPQPQTPATSSWYNTANNRLNGASYDAAGNQTTLGALTLAYDAEGRATQAQQSVVGQSWTTQYRYDGDGRRVKKVDAAGETTVFVYDATGSLAAEYFSGAATATQGVEYLTADHLGSTRMIANETGTVVARRDYQPFGEEIPASIGGRPALFDTQAGVKQQFTGKERDSETGLDYFGARYLAGVLGRWMGADPQGHSMRTMANPQKWNKYSYVLNNPLALVDPDGLEEVTVTYRAFIPQSQASIGGFTFRGDNRTFSTAAAASSRIAISVRVETDPSIRANPLISTQRSVGQTERISPFPAVDTAKSGLPTANVSRDQNGNVVIRIDANAKNPLVPFPASLVEPGIRPNLTVTIPIDASSATVTGQSSAFPAQEVNGMVGTATNPLFQFSPAGASPIDLYRTVQVNQTKPLPQCTTDADGKKKCQ